jgi:hypothetical protein
MSKINLFIDRIGFVFKEKYPYILSSVTSQAVLNSSGLYTETAAGVL